MHVSQTVGPHAQHTSSSAVHFEILVSHVKGYRVPDWERANIASNLDSLFFPDDDNAFEPVGIEEDWTLGLLAPERRNAASSSYGLPGLSALAPQPVPPGEGALRIPPE